MGLQKDITAHEWKQYISLFEAEKKFSEKILIQPFGEKLLIYLVQSRCNFYVYCNSAEWGELMIEKCDTEDNDGRQFLFPSDLFLLIDLLKHIATVFNVKLVLRDEVDNG